MNSRFDVVVIGTGALGSSVLLHLARQGVSCIGLDRHSPGHHHGSSHGETRAIRKAYFEHPNYVPLLESAYLLWEEVELLSRVELGSDQRLFERPGLLEIGPEDGVIVKGVRAAAAEHNLKLEELDERELRDRFPGFPLPAGDIALLEPDAGYLRVEACVSACCALAQHYGAELRSTCEVEHWKQLSNGLQIDTSEGSFECEKLIVTAGAWASRLLKTLPIGLQILRKHMHWFPNQSPHYMAERNAPLFFYETPKGFFYGFPSLDGKAIKVAEHSGGEPIAGPEAFSKEIDATDLHRVQQFLRSHFPAINSTPVRHEACMYTMSPDEHFIIDQYPETPNATFAAGLSGHGFKFAPVLGLELAKCAMTGQLDPSLDFLRLSRFATH